MVIAAGSTGSIPATRELLKVIAHLPNGAVVLPGLDRMLDDASWETLDPGHPQYGLKQLLDRIGATRDSVKDWDGGAANPAREHLLSDTLRPAPTTDAWRALVERGGGDLEHGVVHRHDDAATDPVFADIREARDEISRVSRSRPQHHLGMPAARASATASSISLPQTP